METSARERAERRLAAILAADIAGYSRLIGADEEGTLNRIRSIRADIIDPAIAVHRGRLVKTTGDGMLVEFASVVDALRCALDIQRQMTDRSGGISPTERIEYRIGIHQGDVVVEGSDIFGDGVNIAARLEAFAEPGGICVSARVQEDAAGRRDLAFEDLGEQSFKNITRPIRTYRVVNGESQPSAGAVPRAKSAPRLSVVVLPFANLSSDPEHEYFVEAITDDLTTDLIHIPESFVIARNTALSYKGKPVDVRRIAHELGVRYVLEGSVRWLGVQLQVNVQLIAAENGHHIWADRFITDSTDLARAQNAVTARLARALRLELLMAVGREIELENAVDLDASDLIIRGWALYLRPMSAENRDAALRAFEQALEIDRESVEARVGIANILDENLSQKRSKSRSEDVARSEQLLLEALQRDSNHPRVHFELGRLRRIQNRLIESVIELERALELDRNYVMSIQHLGIARLYLAEPEIALPHFETALELSLHLQNIHILHFWRGYCLLLMGRADDAVTALRRACAGYPGLYFHHLYLAVALALTDKLEEARTSLAESIRLKPEARSIAALRAERFPYEENPPFRALREKTIELGLRRAGMPEV